jgi:hypothetical protein
MKDIVETMIWVIALLAFLEITSTGSLSEVNERFRTL